LFHKFTTLLGHEFGSHILALLGEAHEVGPRLLLLTEEAIFFCSVKGKGVVCFDYTFPNMCV
jgi:hypothetical protein